MTMIPESITFDGTADVAADLTTWLATPNNYPDGVITFQPDGMYRIDDGNVEIDQAEDLIIDGNGATLFRTAVPTVRYPLHSSFLYLTTSATNVIIRNFTIVGVNAAPFGSLNEWADLIVNGRAVFYEDDGVTTNTAGEAAIFVANNWFGHYCVSLAFDHAFEIVGAYRVVVEDNTVRGVFGDGVLFHEAISDMIIRRNHVSLAGRQGIAFNQGHNILVDNNTINGARHAAIDLECDGNNQSITNCEIRNNYFNSFLTAFASIGPGAINDIYFHHNTVYRNCVIAGTNDGELRRYRWRIEDNIFNYQGLVPGATTNWSGAPMIILEAYTGISIRRNRGITHVGGIEAGIRLATGPEGWRDVGLNVVSQFNHWEGFDLAVQNGWVAGPWVSDGDSLTSTPPTILDVTDLPASAAEGTVQDLGGSNYRFTNGVWKFIGHQFWRFPPLIDWTV